jgi:hypothetical protein
VARIRPAAHLPANDDPAAVEVAAGLPSRLHQARAGNFAFPALAQIKARMERQSRDDAGYEQRAAATRALAGRPFTTCTRPWPPP